MKMTPTLEAFVDDLARMAKKESGLVVYEDAVKEYTCQILEDDASWMVRFAMDCGMKIPRQLAKFKEAAKNLY